MAMSTQQKTVVITGASRGIGLATATLFLERGWRIITCARGEVSDPAVENPNWLAHIPTDLADSDSVKAFVKRVNEQIGRAHV